MRRRTHPTVAAAALVAVFCSGLAAPAAASSALAPGTVGVAAVPVAWADEPAPAGEAQVHEATAPLDAVEVAGLAEPGATAPAEGAEAAAQGVDGAPVTVAEDLAASTAVPEEPPTQAPVPAPTPSPAEDARLVVGLSEPLDTEKHDVYVAGVTWLAGPEDVTVDVRVQRDGVWGEWELLPVDLAPSSADEGEGDRAGSDPFVLSGVEDVQFRLMTTSGTPPQDPQVAIFGSDVTRDDAATSARAPLGTAAGTLPAPSVVVPPTADMTAGAVATGSGLTAPRPLILSRSAWQALAPVGPMDIGTVQGATVHHTAGTNDYAMSAVPAILRGIQRYHTGTRDWSDIGYNFLVDRFGRIWEGRAGGVDNTMKGVHASSFNGLTTGISVMGNFETATVSAETREALTALLAWKLALHGVDAAGTLRTPTGQVFPAIVGHKDVPEAQTACPGRNLYPLLPTLRSAAATRQVHERTLVTQDVDGDGAVDVVDVAGAGRAYLGTEPGTTSPFQARRPIGSAWQGMDLVIGSPTLIRGSGAADLVARERATGRLHIYHGNGRGGFSGVTPWGRGWGGMSAVIAPGDWSGDGLADVIAIHRATGNMYLYRGDGRGGTAQGVQIGRGWGGIESVASTGDIDGDGRRDLVALTSRTDQLLLYRGSGTGGFLGSTVLAGDVTGYREVLGAGDVTGDGRNDVLLRPDVEGRLTTVLNLGGGKVRIGPSWDTGWSTSTVMSGVPGWNGAGSAVVVMVDAATGTMHSAQADQAARFRQGAALGLRTDARQSVVVGDVTGTGGSSVVTVTAGNALYLSEARGDGTFAAPRQIGTNWGAMTQIAPAGDLDYDGVPDLLAVDTGGRLYVYPFLADGSGTLGEPSVIGHGFGPYRVLGVGGWSRSTGADVLAINRSTGQLLWFVGHGRNRLTGGTVIGTGWQGMADVAAIGDASGAGNNDIVTRDVKTGTWWIYFANGTGGFAGRQAVAGVPRRVG